MKKIAVIICILACSQLTTAQICTRTVQQFVAGPTGYTISGTATLSDSTGKLSIEFSSDFSTTAGPDLYVYLAQKNESPTTIGNATVEIDSLISNTGAQKILVPSGVNINDYDYILIHCKKFDHFWGGGLLGTLNGTCLLSIANNQLSESLTLSAWPNPFNHEATVNMSSKDNASISFFITDVSGKVVQSKSKLTTKSFVIGAGLESGLYFLNVTSNNESKIIKLVKF